MNTTFEKYALLAAVAANLVVYVPVMKGILILFLG